MSAPTQVFKGNAAVVRVNGNKVATCTSSDVDYATNKSDVPMSDGLGISAGYPIGTVNVSTFETSSGLSGATLAQIIAAQDIIQIEFTQGGQTILITGTGQKFSRKSQTDKRMTDGTYSFSGAVEIL